MNQSLSVGSSLVSDIINNVEEVYNELETVQGVWAKATPSPCPNGCGTCCIHFHPDISEAEALYMANWMLINQYDRAMQIAAETFKPADNIAIDGCPLFDPNNPHHCTIYGGRGLICRLFGLSGDAGKDGTIRWRNCKFNNQNNIANHQYSEEEMKEKFHALPPSMEHYGLRIASLSPDNISSTELLYIALHDAICKLLFLKHLTTTDDDCPPIAS